MVIITSIKYLQYELTIILYIIYYILYIIYYIRYKIFIIPLSAQYTTFLNYLSEKLYIFLIVSVKLIKTNLNVVAIL
jgi:hypothetical protein